MKQLFIIFNSIVRSERTKFFAERDVQVKSRTFQVHWVRWCVWDHMEALLMSCNHLLYYWFPDEFFWYHVFCSNRMLFVKVALNLLLLAAMSIIVIHHLARFKIIAVKPALLYPYPVSILEASIHQHQGKKHAINQS